MQCSNLHSNLLSGVWEWSLTGVWDEDDKSAKMQSRAILKLNAVHSKLHWPFLHVRSWYTRLVNYYEKWSYCLRCIRITSLYYMCSTAQNRYTIFLSSSDHSHTPDLVNYYATYCTASSAAFLISSLWTAFLQLLSLSDHSHTPDLVNYYNLLRCD